ncbi:MAG: hypothetical protein FWE98_07785 [Oscillospiraceae bacterium]|nr:hypothetical protein [Oscillospiraceae bacterium]
MPSHERLLPRLVYYMDCNRNFWMPYEVPADRDECWCWEGCPPPTGAAGAR